MASATAAQTSAPAAARSHLPWIIGIAVVARIALAIVCLHINPPHRLTALGDENISIALSLLAHHGFASPFRFESGPTAFMTPGYPLLIAGFMRMMGTGLQAHIGIIAFQILLSLATVLLTTLVAQRYFGIRSGNLAGLICAIAQPILLAPLYIWDTCLSALILTGAVAVAPETRSKYQFAFAGFGCALATLVNPSLVFALLAIFAWSAWRARIVPWLGMLVFLIAFSPWPIRNYTTMHAFVPLRSNFGFELWAGNHPGDNGETDQFERPTFNDKERELFLSEGELGYMREKNSEALTWIKAHPGEFAKLTIRRFVRFWIGSSKSSAPMTVPLVLVAFAGVLLLRRSYQLFILFALPIVIYPLPYYITHADVRYQFVLDPLLAILAGYACESFFAWCAHRSAPSPTIAEAS